MTVGSSPHPSLPATIQWLEARLAYLDSIGDFEAS